MHSLQKLGCSQGQLSFIKSCRSERMYKGLSKATAFKDHSHRALRSVCKHREKRHDKNLNPIIRNLLPRPIRRFYRNKIRPLI